MRGCRRSPSVSATSASSTVHRKSRFRRRFVFPWLLIGSSDCSSASAATVLPRNQSPSSSRGTVSSCSNRRPRPLSSASLRGCKGSHGSRATPTDGVLGPLLASRSLRTCARRRRGKAGVALSPRHAFLLSTARRVCSSASTGSWSDHSLRSSGDAGFARSQPRRLHGLELRPAKSLPLKPTL